MPLGPAFIAGKRCVMQQDKFAQNGMNAGLNGYNRFKN